MTRKWNLRNGMIMAVAILWFSQGIAQGATDDDLEQIEGRFQALYWKPGKSLDQYKRIVLLDCFVQFREDWLEDENRGKRPNEEVTEDEMKAILETLSSQFREIFSEVLVEDDGYELVNVAAPDVLILRPGIVNLDVGASVYSSRSITENSPLNLTLYLEFFDSSTSALIGRALEKRADPESNRSTVGRIIRRWAQLARATLDEGPGA